MTNTTIEKQDYFMKLLEPIHNKLEHYCLAITGNREDAKDLMSESILQTYLRIDDLKDADKFPNYIFRVAKRIYFKKIRHSSRYQSLNDSVIFKNDPSPDASKKLDHLIVHEAISKLPIKLRQALILHKISGFSHREISEIEQCSLSATKARVSRAMAKLEKLLK